jgi:ABC-type branched-subunit amino acid transport system substrate-binding protein
MLPSLPGSLFDDSSASEQQALLQSVKMVNDDRTILTKSEVIVRDEGTYPRDDSFKASRRLCDLIKHEVAAIFGPTAPISSNHVQSVADTLHLPFMETRWHYGFQKSAFSIHLHPHPAVLGKAYADFIQQVGWKSLVILYETEEGLVRLQEVLRLQQTFKGDGLKVTSRQLVGSSRDEKGRPDYRPLLKEIKKSEERNIVLDCDFDRIHTVLEQAEQIELLTDYHSYLITSLDLEKVNLEAFSLLVSTLALLLTADFKIKPGVNQSTI